MIASFLRNFIFIKTRKTAGTSIEIFLSGHCGPDDIVTPIGLADERTRIVDGTVAAKNYSGDRALEAAFAEAVLENDARKAREIVGGLRGAGHFHNHMAAAKIAAKLPADFWTSAMKITVERHPYEKVVSLAYFRLYRSGLPAASFGQILDAVIQHGGVDDFSRYSLHGTPIVDRILRQENLLADMQELGRLLGFPVPAELPRAKSTMRLDRRPAAEILSAEQKRAIVSRNRYSFEVLGYAP
jgi:hypothetical protein